MLFARDLRLRSAIFDNKLFSVQVKAMRFGGFVIGENQKFELWHFWRSAFITISIAVSSLLGFKKLIIRNFGEGSAMSSATAFLYLSTSIAIHNAFFQRRSGLARMLCFVQDDLDRLQSKSDKLEDEHFAKTHRYMSIITIFVWTPSVVAGAIAYIDAFYRLAFNPNAIFNLEEVRNGTAAPALLIKLYPFREVHDSLIVGYLFPMYSLLLGITLIPVWHTFICSLILYVLLKWRIMHKRLSTMDVSKVILNPHELTYYSTLTAEDDRINYLRTRLCKFCADEQIRIRWFVKELQELIYIPVFADFMIFSIMICFLFYEMAVWNTNKMDFLFMCLYLYVISTVLWLYHWHATLIKEYSFVMCFAIYSCEWYTYPVRVQKLVLHIMTIATIPLEMKAVFIKLNLTTYIDIIRASFSYFSILKNFT